MAAAKKKTAGGRKQDRARVAGAQGFEPKHSSGGEVMSRPPLPTFPPT
jgi:hypothetical protein